MSFGVLYTCYNDAEDIVKSYKSLLQTIPPDTSFKLVVTDAGSTEDQLQLIRSELGTEPFGPYPNLTDALNAGFYRLMGYEESNIKNINEGGPQVDHVLWLHGDTMYEDYDWINKLIFCYEFVWPLIGRMGPATRNIDGSDPNVSVLRGGNTCPILFSSKVLIDLINKYGWIYNPNFINIGGREDWDNGRRLQELGYGFGICSLVDVWHKGMGTRERRDTNKDMIYNADVYYQYWNTWDQPGFEIDMTEIGNELRKAFEEKYKVRWYDKKD